MNCAYTAAITLLHLSHSRQRGRDERWLVAREALGVADRFVPRCCCLYKAAKAGLGAGGGDGLTHLLPALKSAVHTEGDVVPL